MDPCVSGHPRWFTIPRGRDRGNVMFYTDELVGREEGNLRTLILVHGNPECSCIFNPLIRVLLNRTLPRTRLITFDHVGFGRSGLATRPMSPADHAANFAHLLESLSPRAVTLVVHDWGGPIALGAFLDHPESLRSLVILNSGIFPLRRGCNYRNHPFPVLSWKNLGALVPDRYWGHFAAGAIACRATGRVDLLRKLLCPPRTQPQAAGLFNPYYRQFAARGNACSSKHLARLTGQWCEAGDRSEPELNAFYLRLQAGVGKCWGLTGTAIQARLLCGQWDPLGDEENARRWLQALPQLEDQMVFFSGAGHFLPESHPREIAHTIYELLTAPGGEG
ncbi:MAG: alpha/beta hydrolase [bacterium]